MLARSTLTSLGGGDHGDAEHVGTRRPERPDCFSGSGAGGDDVIDDDHRPASHLASAPYGERPREVVGTPTHGQPGLVGDGSDHPQEGVDAGWDASGSQRATAFSAHPQQWVMATLAHDTARRRGRNDRCHPRGRWRSARQDPEDAEGEGSA